MLRSTDVADTYADGRYLRRWSIIDGQPRCMEDAYRLGDIEPSTVIEQVERNREVRRRIVAVETFEAAQALLARVAALPAPPSETVAAFGIDGQPTVVPNPDHDAWQAARVAVEQASDLTRAYAVVRLGKPQEPGPLAEPSPEWTAYQQAVATIEAAD